MLGVCYLVRIFKPRKFLNCQAIDIQTYHTTSLRWELLHSIQVCGIVFGCAFFLLLNVIYRSPNWYNYLSIYCAYDTVCTATFGPSLRISDRTRVYIQSKIFCRGVSGHVTRCPCGVWCRGLSTCPCKSAQLLANIFQITWLARSIESRIFLLW